jgi:hypothetical protein
VSGVVKFSSTKIENSPRQKTILLPKSLVPRKRLVVKKTRGTIGLL